MKQKGLKSILAFLFVLCVAFGIQTNTVSAEGDTDKAIKVEYDGNTYYFDHFGGTDRTVTDTTSTDNGLSYWMCKNTEAGKTITITLLKDITEIDVYYKATGNIANTNPWAITTGKHDANLYIPSGRTVVLNMNEHNISGSGQTKNKLCGLISNLGHLTINGNGIIENQGSMGYVIYSMDTYSTNVSLSLNNITIKQGEAPTNASVYTNYGTIDSIENCKFINSGSNGAISIASNASVGTIKNCTFSEGIKCAIYLTSTGDNPAIKIIDGCTINCSGNAIYGAQDAYACANIGTIQNTSITASGSAVWGVRYIEVIDSCNIEVTGHETQQAATAAKILQTTVGIGKITGNTYIGGDYAIPIYADGGSVTIESGTFESGFDTVVYVGNYGTSDLSILGGTYIKGENVLDSAKDIPVVLRGGNDIVYPFGKILDEWQEDQENTFTLDYNAEKIEADTAAALEAIEGEQDADTKAELAKTLQQNINAITDEDMRTTAQTQADTNLKTVNGTVTITLTDGDSSQEITVAKGSIPVIAVPQKENYAFEGWYTDESLSTPYEAGVVDEALTLYAKWKEVHQMTHYEAAQATCEEEGNIEYWYCSICDKNFADENGTTEITETVSIPATGHNWSEPVWTWSEDHSSATATFTCANDTSHVATLAAEGTSVTSVITKPATCTEDGEKTYTAAVNLEEKTYTATDTVTVDKIDHSFGEWETVESPNCTDNGSQQRTCSVCGFTETEELDAEGHDWEADYTVDKAATCTEDGSRSIHCKNCDAVKDSVVIPATGHDWSEPVWTWSEDYSSAAATFTCANDTSHVETLTATPASEITKPATCTEDGEKTYTVTVKLGEKEYTDSKTAAVEKTGHSFSDEWKSDETSHWHECDCGEKTEIENHTFEWVIDKEATVDEAGSKHEECAVCGYKKSAVEIPKKEKDPQNPTTDDGTKPVNTDETTSNTTSKTTSDKTSDIPNTGDTVNMTLWIALIVLSGGLLGIAVGMERKKRK